MASVPDADPEGSPKPFLFLDCDGVVSPIPSGAALDARWFTPPAGYFMVDDGRSRMYYDDRLPAWIGRLDAAFEIVWSSSWDEASLWSIVGSPLGLRRWPSVSAPDFRGRTSVDYKAKAVRAHLNRDLRPFAWVDDHLRPGRPNRYVARLDVPKLLLKPNKYVGLTTEHVERLLGFAAADRPARDQ